MKTPTTFTLMTALVAVLLTMTLGVTGCSNDASTPPSQTVTAGDDYQNLDFRLPNGGLTASDEEVAFGDKALAEDLYREDQDASDDPMQTDPEVMRMQAMAGGPSDSSGFRHPLFTFVRLEWGMLHGPVDSLPPPSDCGVLDWSGRIAVDRGLLVVRRMIQFEKPLDYLVRPRTDRRAVDFVSHTACRFDGLVLQIIERPQDMDLSLPANRIHITAGPYTGDFNLNELVGMNQSFPVDDQGHSLHLAGYTLNDLTRCPKGFLNGRWMRRSADAPADSVPQGDPALSEQLGGFGGPVLGLNGRIEGFLRGGYGLDENGNHRFFGKQINRGGHFTAFVSGTWESAPDGVSLAGFEGSWMTLNGQREGVLGGRAFPGPRDDHGGGFFEGRWSSLCDPAAEDQVR